MQSSWAGRDSFGPDRTVETTQDEQPRQTLNSSTSRAAMDSEEETEPSIAFSELPLQGNGFKSPIRSLANAAQSRQTSTSADQSHFPATPEPESLEKTPRMSLDNWARRLQIALLFHVWCWRSRHVEHWRCDVEGFGVAGFGVQRVGQCRG